MPPAWRPVWEAAQQLWGVQLHEPQVVALPEPPSFAWFSFPPEITIDARALQREGADGELESVLAHEIGHHVLSPATRLDALKIRHQLARALSASDRPASSGLIATLSNLWSDQLINVRVADLQRRRDPGSEPGMVRLWRQLTAGTPAGLVDWVVRRSYEVSWGLPSGTLCPSSPPLTSGPGTRVSPDAAARRGGQRAEAPARYAEAERKLQAAKDDVMAAERALDARVVAHPEADAVLLARLVRSFGTDPVAGALGFGMLMAPYLPRQAEQVGDTGIGCGGEAAAAAATAAEVATILGDPRLAAPALHPAAPQQDQHDTGNTGQGYGVAETLALYSEVEPDAVIAAWYRTAAQRWVRPLTQPGAGGEAAEVPGPLQRWDLDDDLADIDWPATLTAAAEIIPGVTTRRRSDLDDPAPPTRTSVQLDLYIDSSGSMPNPRAGSPAVLAGTILVLSVLRGGGTVRVTSWSGPNQVAGTERFGRDPVALIAALAVFLGGGTAFPLDLYHRRYRDLPPAGPGVRRHLVVLSDDGLASMFGIGNDPWAGVAAQVRPALTTATLMLMDPQHQVAPLATAAGYQVSYLESMQDAPAACAALAEVIHGNG